MVSDSQQENARPPGNTGPQRHRYGPIARGHVSRQSESIGSGTYVYIFMYIRHYVYINVYVYVLYICMYMRIYLYVYLYIFIFIFYVFTYLQFIYLHIYGAGTAVHPGLIPRALVVLFCRAHNQTERGTNVVQTRGWLHCVSFYVSFHGHFDVSGICFHLLRFLWPLVYLSGPKTL